MTEYTRAERKAIADGWDWFIEYGERADWETKPRMLRALAYERKGRSSPTVAKAVLLDAFTKGYEMRSADMGEACQWASRLVCWSDGCVQAALIGFSERFSEWEDAETVVAKAKAAVEANRAHTKRMLDAIGGQS